MIGNIGLLLGLAALVFMALRGINIIVAALVASLIVALTNGLGLAPTLLEYFPAGPLGAFTFAGQFFILFLTGAIFGRMMSTSGAAASVANAIIAWLGVRHTILVTVLACAILTYGGVVLFVVIFTMYPLGIALMREARLPKRLFCGAAALGAGTFTMTALPGTPSIHNVIAASALGTDLFAGVLPGLAAAVVMLGGGLWYLEHQWRGARERDEMYVGNERDSEMEKLAPSLMDLPGLALSILPLVVVLGTILVPRLATAIGLVDADTPLVGELFSFANTQPIVWPSIALVMGSLFCVLFFTTMRQRSIEALGAGANDSVMPLLNTAAVIGFGGVVTQTDGFATFAQSLIGLDLPPLVSVALSINLISGIVGSASGGLQIFMQTFAETYLAMGIDPQILHRVATVASGGLDSLPHSGAVIAMLTIMGLKHREAYRDIFVVTVLIPILATVVVISVGVMIG